MSLTREQWATEFLSYAGWPFSLEKVYALCAQAAKESSTARYNPLDTTWTTPTSTYYNSFGPGGEYHVRNYGSLAVGFAATKDTFESGYYPTLLAGLEAASGSFTATAWCSSSELTTWGTGNCTAELDSIRDGDPHGYLTHIVAGTTATAPTPTPTPATTPTSTATTAFPDTTDVAAAWSVPGSDGVQYFELTRAGGLNAYGGATVGALEYVAVSNVPGERYHFGPNVTPGTWTYLQLPQATQTPAFPTRYFVSMDVLSYKSHAFKTQTPDPEPATYEVTSPPPTNVPTVTALSPPTGPTTGGSTVLITGEYFIDVVSVTFGGVDATDVHVLSTTELTVVTPAHATGQAAVTVTNTAGTSTTTILFAYRAPLVPTTPTPAPVTTTPVSGAVTYWLYDLMTYKLYGTLPFHGNVTWTQKLNSAGTFTGQLDLASPGVQRKTWATATRTSRSLLVVTVGNAIVWAGIIWQRPYKSSSRILTVTASEAWSYFSRRTQARDYTTPPQTGPAYTYWHVNPVAAATCCAALVSDALSVPGSAFAAMPITVKGTTPSANRVTESFPISQQQTLASMITDMASYGYGTGFDLGITWGWSAGPGSTPEPELVISYPRAGLSAGENPFVVDFGHVANDDYTWPEDGNQQANYIYGEASGAATLTGYSTDPAVLDAGWPLLEEVESYMAINTQTALTAAVKGDLARLEWPVTTPVVCKPMFATDLSLGDFAIGDTLQIVVPPDERFPDGLGTTTKVYLRVTALNCSAPDAGLATMTMTFNTAPALSPVPAPPGI